MAVEAAATAARGKSSLGFEIEVLGLVADHEHTILLSLSATKPNTSISKPTYNKHHDHTTSLVLHPISTVVGQARECTIGHS